MGSHNNLYDFKLVGLFQYSFKILVTLKHGKNNEYRFFLIIYNPKMYLYDPVLVFGYSYISETIFGKIRFLHLINSF